MRPISFVCHANDDDVLERCLLSSLRTGPDDEVLILKGHPSQSLAYLYALENTAHEVIGFLHQDMHCPQGWREALDYRLAEIQWRDPEWGVCGPYGGYLEWTGPDTLVSHRLGRMRSLTQTWISRVDELPRQVEEVDGCACFLHRGRAQFDAAIPGWHGAVEDLCQSARARGNGVWVIDLYMEHRTQELNNDFAAMDASARVMAAKWARPFYCGNLIIV